MISVSADLTLCQGYANCVTEADDVFDLDEESELVVIVQRNIEDSESSRIERAVRSCPVNALSARRM